MIKNSSEDFSEILAEGRALEDFFTEKGLRNSLGLSPVHWNYAIFKELLDNSLDSIESLEEKKIWIETSPTSLWISDSGNGMRFEEIQQVYNFYGYFSRKRWTRQISRGSLGNALKSIIGLCFIKKYNLEWRLKEGIALKCTLNEMQKNRGNLFFETNLRDYKGPWGIFIEGFQTDFSLYEKILGFHWANPDVTWIVNGTLYEAFAPPLTRRKRVFLSWYDFEAFFLLANRKCRLLPKRTTRSFLKEFYGVARFLPQLPLLYDRLADYLDHTEAFQELFAKLLEKTPTVLPHFLKTFVASKNQYLDYFKKLTYREKVKEFSYKEAKIPYLLQALLLPKEGPNQVLTAVNGSVPYDDFPFRFPEGNISFMGFEENSAIKKNYLYPGYHSLKEVLQHLHFFEGSGHLLFIHWVCPFIEFSDNAKSQINATFFQKELSIFLENITAPILKQIRREELGRLGLLIPDEKKHKKYLMEHHFLDAFETASGGYSVFVRQVFYKLHEILNHQYGLDLRGSDYNLLTQQIATEMMKKYLEVAQRLLFSIRGYFHHSFYGLNLPLGTKEIREYTHSQRQNKIVLDASLKFDFEDRYLLKNILFIEKVGFNIALEESGITRELNLSILSTQGSNTRAGAMLLKYYQDQGLPLYSLTDYDFAGLKIHESIVTDSPTYPAVESVKRIGLSLEEVRALKLVPETVAYKKDYRQSALFQKLPEEEKFFFTKGESLTKRRFQRVELNALSNQQLIDLLKQQLSDKTVVPPDDIILKAFDIDVESLQKTALYLKFGPLFQKIAEPIEKQKILAQIKASPEHWLKTLPQAKAEYERELIQKFCRYLEQQLANPKDGV